MCTGRGERGTRRGAGFSLPHREVIPDRLFYQLEAWWQIFEMRAHMHLARGVRARVRALLWANRSQHSFLVPFFVFCFCWLSGSTATFTANHVCMIAGN